MEKNNQGLVESSVEPSTSTTPNRKIRILKVEEESVGKDREKEKNPLDIPEIIAIVAGHIKEVNDLKGVRTQSKAWRDETFLKWRSSAVFLINDETIPILAKAFGPTNLADLSEEESAMVLKEKDPFGFQELPFKNYRFANARNGQPWSYPLDSNDVVGRIIWEEVVSLKATYLDVGECVLRKFFYAGNWEDFGASYLPGLNWILKHTPNVTDLAIAPLQSSDHVLDLSDSDEDEEEEVKEVRRSLRNEVECQRTEIRSREAWRVATNIDLFRRSVRRAQIGFRMNKAVEAPQIRSLTISTPQQTSFVRDDDTTLKSLINYEVEEAIDFGKWLFDGMLNLKHLQLPTGFGSTSLITGLNRSRHSNSIQLETLTAFAAPPHLLLPDQLNRFISSCRPPLRELRMAVKSGLSSSNFVFKDIFRILRLVQETIEKMEFEVYCEQQRDSKKSDVKFSLAEKGAFPNLTRLKITLDSGNSLPNNLRFDLNRMPKLQSFHFGLNKEGSEAWTNKKLQVAFVGNLDATGNVSGKLPSLEEFYCNGNLSGYTLSQLGEMAKKLKTLELVLDEENVPGVGNICRRLKKLILLPGSDAPEGALSVIKKAYSALNIFDKAGELNSN